MLRKHRILIVLPVGLIFISLYDLRACIQTGSSVFNQVVGLKTRIIFENENSSKENIATKASCYKTGEFNTFYICNDSLPFSSTACGKSEQDALEYKVPNIVHYVWFGEMNLKYYHYLSVRSAAANQHPDAIMFHINGSKPGGEYWKRVEKEIPCITLVKMEAPTSIHNKEISDVLHQTDVARMQILLKYGGIYLDSDVIILKSFNPLRKYPFTIGRSTEYSLSNGVMLSEPDSSFIKEWMSYFNKYDQHKIRGIHYADFSIKLPFRLHSMRPDLMSHVEETSLQRPNPWIDGRICISHSSYDISENYALHIHPQKSLLKDPKVLLEYREEELRTFDSTYGAGARLALFGFQDLVYMRSELLSAKNRTKMKKIEKFKPVREYQFSSLLEGL